MYCLRIYKFCQAQMNQNEKSLSKVIESHYKYYLGKGKIEEVVKLLQSKPSTLPHKQNDNDNKIDSEDDNEQNDNAKYCDCFPPENQELNFQQEESKQENIIYNGTYEDNLELYFSQYKSYYQKPQQKVIKQPSLPLLVFDSSQSEQNEEKSSSLELISDFPKNSLHEELLQCLTLLSKKLPKELSYSSLYSVFNISSLSEDAFIALSQSNQLALIRWHFKHLTRVYPSGLRVASSNYNAIQMQKFGAQLVALNFQTHDKDLLALLAFFKENGGANSGYVLKPPFLREFSNFLNIKQPQILKITLIAGQVIGFLVDIFISLEIYPSIEPFRTPSIKIKNEMFLDIPEYESFEFSAKFKLAEEEFSVLMIQIKRKDIIGDTVIAQVAISVKLIREGIRAIQMYDKNGELIKNCVLVFSIAKLIQ